MEFSYIWGRWSCFQVRKVMFAFDREIWCYSTYIMGEQKNWLNWENRLNRETRKKITEKTKPYKKNRLKFWKNRPVRFSFGFISKKPNQNRKKPGKNRAKLEKKPSQTGLTGFCLKKPNRTETIDLNRFRFFF